MESLEAKKTAVVLIDLQEGITGMPLMPQSGSNVVASALEFAKASRSLNALIVLVRVCFANDYADVPPQDVDMPMPLPPDGLPKNWDRLDSALETHADIVITKRQWSAFHGTELDLQLRRRGIENIILGGIATNFGVESTARQAWEHGYKLIVAEDLCTSFSKEMHEFTVSSIFPHIARVKNSKDIVLV